MQDLKVEENFLKAEGVTDLPIKFVLNLLVMSAKEKWVKWNPIFLESWLKSNVSSLKLRLVTVVFLTFLPFCDKELLAIEDKNWDFGKQMILRENKSVKCKMRVNKGVYGVNLV